MIKSYIKTILRFLWRRKFFASVNILCLTSALTALYVIGIYVHHEWSFDRHLMNSDRLYRVSMEVEIAGRSNKSPITVAPLGPTLKEQMPEVHRFTRTTYPFQRILQYRDKNHNVDRVVYADSNFFNLFSYEVRLGRRSNLLRDPHTVVLTRSGVDRIFGNENPMGKSITLDGVTVLTVTGVVEDFPSNSHLDADAVVSLSTMFAESIFHEEMWTGGFNYYTYLELSSADAADPLRSKLESFADRTITPKFNDPNINTRLYLQPVTDIHLYSDSSAEIKPSGAIVDVLSFSGIGLIILLIAGINYVILSTALGSRRAKEIGVRRTLGASRRQISVQFLSEAFLLIAISMLISLPGLIGVAPYFEPYMGISLEVSKLLIPGIILPIVLLVMLLGLGGGAYSGILLTGKGIPEMFRKNLFTPARGLGFRNLLLVFQFMLAGFVIFITFTIYHQYRFMLFKPVGLEAQNRIVVSLPNDQVRNQKERLKAGLSGLAGIERTSTMSSVPFQGVTSNGYIPESEQEYFMLNQIDVDEQFISIFGLEIVEGSDFPASPELSADKCIINERAAAVLGWDQPLGKTLRRNGKDFEVIGVVADFHFNSLHHRIEPLVLRRGSELSHFDLVVEVAGSGYANMIERIRAGWEQMVGQQPFFYSFFEEQLTSQYRSENNLFRLFSAFAFIGVLLSLTGLISIVAFTLTRSMKEIGVRKVFGATSSDILKFFYRKFALYLGIGFVSSVLLGSIAADFWYASFPYQAGLAPETYLLTAVVVVVIPSMAIFLQLKKGSSVSPIHLIEKQ